MVRNIYRGKRNQQSLLGYSPINPTIMFGSGLIPFGGGPFGALAVPDAIGPTAAITIANVAVTNSTIHEFTVVYTDTVEIDPTTIDGSELLITGPNAYSEAPTLVGFFFSEDGTTATVTYHAPGPGANSLWDGGTKLGTYTVSSVANTVTDSEGNSIAAGALGTFDHV